MARHDAFDFSKLQHAMRSANTTGDGSMSFTELPSTILEALIPGYSLISKFAFQALGFDISIIVSLGVILFALFTGTSYFYNRSYSIFFKYFSASVYIEQDDDLFDATMKWISEQRMTQRARSLTAVTQYAGPSESDSHAGAVDEAGIFNFGMWTAKLPPMYKPYYGLHHFWYNGRLFFFDRTRREAVVRSPWQSRGEDEQTIQLTTIGRSTQPVKDLIAHIKAWSLGQEESETTIRRPAPKDSRRPGTWNRVTSRPSRPMDTVVLDPVYKQRLVNDVNEFLHPSSPKWYATRGIPYRRGYLFHGPPGTGKSSLSFALAGLFGLDIFVVSLLEPTLTESDLSHLFTNLPRRCIVLLEDIDTAGLLRDDKSDDSNEAANEGKPEKSESAKDSKVSDEVKVFANELAKSMRKSNKGFGGGGRQTTVDGESKQGISLSGLLNAIDGVASHEGRVLVMTTNHPEKLDNALIRPGRVDMQVQFTLASKHQAREIFVRMYSDDEGENSGKNSKVSPQVRNTANHVSKPHTTIDCEQKPIANGAPKALLNVSDYSRIIKSDMTPPATPKESKPSSADGSVVEFDDLSQPPPYIPGPSPAELSPEQLYSMADQFADRIPEATLSPAEVQNFLIARKKEPQRALNEVDTWKASVIEAKEKGTKVIGVQ